MRLSVQSARRKKPETIYLFFGLVYFILLGNPHPFYESPFPVEIGETEGLDEPLHSQVLKRNPAPPEDCTVCCQDMW